MAILVSTGSIIWGAASIFFFSIKTLRSWELGQRQRDWVSFPSLFSQLPIFHFIHTENDHTSHTSWVLLDAFLQGYNFPGNNRKGQLEILVQVRRMKILFCLHHKPFQIQGEHYRFISWQHTLILDYLLKSVSLHSSLVLLMSFSTSIL